MTEDGKLALIVAYYLSRCDKEAWANLGYTSTRQGFAELGDILNVNPSTLRYRRDEFDAYNNNSRVGWLRPISGTRAKIVQAFQDTDDDALLEIVKEIINNKTFRDSEEYADMIAVLAAPSKKRVKPVAPFYAPRGQTGRTAENLFKEYFERTKLPVDGELVDRRDDGCGYDYEIRTRDGSHLVEVKGLAADEGGILFTNKEWEVARKAKEKYYVVIIRNLSGEPILEVIQNPTAQLSPKKSIYTSIQVSWTVPANMLKSLRKRPG